MPAINGISIGHPLDLPVRNREEPGHGPRIGSRPGGRLNGGGVDIPVLHLLWGFEGGQGPPEGVAVQDIALPIPHIQDRRLVGHVHLFQVPGVRVGLDPAVAEHFQHQAEGLIPAGLGGGDDITVHGKSGGGRLEEARDEERSKKQIPHCASE